MYAEVERGRENCSRECGIREGRWSSGPRMNVLETGVRASPRKDWMHIARKACRGPLSIAHVASDPSEKAITWKVKLWHFEISPGFGHLAV